MRKGKLKENLKTKERGDKYPDAVEDEVGKKEGREEG